MGGVFSRPSPPPPPPPAPEPEPVVDSTASQATEAQKQAAALRRSRGVGRALLSPSRLGATDEQQQTLGVG